jgi:hypothetical protein
MADQELRDLRRSLTAHERGRGRRLPPELRAAAAAWAQRQLASGATVAAVARALQVAPATVSRWQSVPRAMVVTALVPVEIVADEPATTTATGSLTLVGPGGYRVEGLTIAEAATLLRALR